MAKPFKDDEVQKDSYEQTFSKEKDSLKQQNQERKELYVIF